MWIIEYNTLPRASCAVPYIACSFIFLISSYLGFDQPSLQLRLITFSLATSLFVYIYLDITLDG